jgi:ribulose-phosphate 3-epimerase
MPDAVPKIHQVKQYLDELDSTALIEVDGGINPQTIRQTADQGAQVFVAASAIFHHPQGIKAGIDSLRQQLS